MKPEEKQAYQISDPVTSPSHYHLFGNYEVRHLISNMIGKMANSNIVMNREMADGMEAAAWYKDAIKYLMRWHSKDGLQDLKKCVECIHMMIDVLEERPK